MKYIIYSNLLIPGNPIIKLYSDVFIVVASPMVKVGKARWYVSYIPIDIRH